MRDEGAGPDVLAVKIQQLGGRLEDARLHLLGALGAEVRQETMDLGQTQRAFDIGYATQARQLADEDIARTQALAHGIAAVGQPCQRLRSR